MVTLKRASWWRAFLLGSVLAGDAGAEEAARLPTGQFITPQAVPGVSMLPLNPGLVDYPDYVAGQAMSQVVSPDGKTLLVLTSGFNSLQVPSTGKFDRQASSEFVFVFDVSLHRPVKRQVLQIQTANAGIAFSPDGQHFYVGTGGGDGVATFALSGGMWSASGNPIPLGHVHGVGLRQGPSTAGLAVTADGSRLLVADEFNDSVSLVELATGSRGGELDLRPGVEDAAKAGVAGGETPFWVVVQGPSAYVSSERDREIDVLDLSPPVPALRARIAVAGTPGKMLVDAQSARLFVAADNDDSVQIIDLHSRRVTGRVFVGSVGAPERAPRFRGAAPNDLALSADGRRLFVSLGGENAVAVLDVTAGQAPRIDGLIPTGWYPQAVSVVGGWVYVSNSRSDPGPNPGHCTSQARRDAGAAYLGSCRANQYVLQLEGSNLQSFQIPPESALDRLSADVERNDGLTAPTSRSDAAMMSELHRHIRHVIYVIKENRTYDQILGDLGKGNGDPTIVEFGRAITPNLHALAAQFVDLDAFEDSSEVSGNGWQWDLQGRETDFNVKTVPLEYSRRKTNAPYDSEGEVRNVDVGLGSLANRMRADPNYPNNPNLLPGTNSDDVADGPDDDGPEGTTQTGLIWDAALKAGLTVRNYGVEVTNVGDVGDPAPFERHDPQAVCHTPALRDHTDVYFRGFDQKQPDLFRYLEWHREFEGFEKSGALPAFELVRLSHDHMGSFGSAIAGVNTPELQQADDDYAVGALVQDVARSRYGNDTLIFIIEDDAQDGPDHVDAHRSTAYVVGPYVRQGAVVSTPYNTVNMVRTIEDVLGIEHLSLFDAHQSPMSSVFDLSKTKWDFSAQPSSYLRATSLPLPWQHAADYPSSTHGGSWWAERTADYDFSREDRVPALEFNRLVWSGLKGDAAYPSRRSGIDLSPR